MISSIAETYSVFEQPWWLDATAPGQWDVVEIEESGTVVARMPFVYKKKFGLRILTQPPLTQTLGPWISRPADRSASKHLAREKDLYGKLISKLPKFDVFRQNFHSNISNWLPFYWQGFSQTTNYSYVLEDLTDHDFLQSQMSQALRRQIRGAAKNIHVESAPSLEAVIDLIRKTYSRQGKALPFSVDLLHRIDEAALVHGHRRAFLGVDESGREHSAVYVVGDERRAYLLASGADPELRDSGSGSLVHWHAIKEASNFTRVFDFEGSMIEPIEDFYRKFGARQVPYSSISKMGGMATTAIAMRNVFRR